MKVTSRTPEELRLATLHLARKILSENMHMQRDTHPEDETKVNTVEDVIAAADKLTAFVNTGSDSPSA